MNTRTARRVNRLAPALNKADAIWLAVVRHVLFGRRGNAPKPSGPSPFSQEPEPEPEPENVIETPFGPAKL
jgi:hypothetical protein